MAPSPGTSDANFRASLIPSELCLSNMESSLLSISPGLSTYYTPVCSDDIKAYVGQLFDYLDNGFIFRA